MLLSYSDNKIHCFMNCIILLMYHLDSCKTSYECMSGHFHVIQNPRANDGQRYLGRRSGVFPLACYQWPTLLQLPRSTGLEKISPGAGMPAAGLAPSRDWVAVNPSWLKLWILCANYPIELPHRTWMNLVDFAPMQLHQSMNSGYFPMFEFHDLFSHVFPIDLLLGIHFVQVSVRPNPTLTKPSKPNGGIVFKWCELMDLLSQIQLEWFGDEGQGCNQQALGLRKGHPRIVYNMYIICT